jgi:hypothetical protein
MTEDERTKLAPMTTEYFLAATRFKTWATVGQHLKALEASGYFGDSAMSAAARLRHVESKLKSLSPRGPRRRHVTLSPS